ncbi:MAG: putative DNA modification/repair radical SAM protein [Prosthecochloris sp.]|nr:putative DNA modification/repair radical SAM protein [Prosthecochloris sp.]
MDTLEKLEVLAGSARYDASCASGGSAGNSGVCHSWSDDGRCVSLLKVLLSNECSYDCAYCLNRSSNSVRRATFTVEELVGLVMRFYRRNYIEGLFLSSAVLRSPDETMARMVSVAERLRTRERFGGYIHMKVIPGSSPALVQRAGEVADRVSVNIELPSSGSLSRLAPQKDRNAIFGPMSQLGRTIGERVAERRRSRRAPRFAPAGQSTQMIIGASPESDRQILLLSEALYGRMNLRRVYYSAYVPVVSDNRLPVPASGPPLQREHRLYQADWLLRNYGFSAAELLDDTAPFLDEELDPKAAWALRHPEYFPVDINRADYGVLLRVPGIGVTSARRILSARRFAMLDVDGLKKIGVVLKRARYFIVCGGGVVQRDVMVDERPSVVRRRLLEACSALPEPAASRQLVLPGLR